MPVAGVAGEQTKVLVARGCVLLFGCIAYTLAVAADGVYALVEQASALGSSGALVVICFGLFTGFGGAAAALTTLMIGTASYILFSLIGALAPFLLSLGCALLCYVVISLHEFATDARARRRAVAEG